MCVKVIRICYNSLKEKNKLLKIEKNKEKKKKKIYRVKGIIQSKYSFFYVKSFNII